MATLNIPRHNQIPTPEQAFDSMFGQAAKKEYEDIELSRLIPYDNQPFRPYDDEKLEELAESIKAHGLLTPIIVRKLGVNLYQILAGHNRVAAVKRLGEERIKALVKTVDDDEAALIMLDTNLQQRLEFLPSELAKAYRMQLETMKRKAGRPVKDNPAPLEPDFSRQNNSAPMEPNLRSNEELAQKVGKSRAQIQRYIRLNYLVPDLLSMVDRGETPFRAGVLLSYLTEPEQERLLEYHQLRKPEITLSQAEQLKKLHEEKELMLTDIEAIFEPATASKTEPKQKEKAITIKLPFEKYSGYFPQFSPKEIAEKVEELIENWCKSNG